LAHAYWANHRERRKVLRARPGQRRRRGDRPRDGDRRNGLQRRRQLAGARVRNRRSARAGRSDLKPKIEAAAKAPPSPFTPPEQVPENWPKVRKYLTDVRRLSAGLVDKLHGMGKVYADRYANAVFVLSKGVGVELRGTGEKPFHGVRGEKAHFIIADRGEQKLHSSSRRLMQ